MEQYGEVIAVMEGTARVRVRRHSACRDCGRCGMGIIGGEPVDPEIEVRNPIGAQVGQVVKITMDTRKLLSASFLMYLLPILGLITGVALGQGAALRLNLAQGRGADLAGLALGLFIMALIFAFARWRGRRMTASPRFIPVAVAVVEAGEPAGERGEE